MARIAGATLLMLLVWGQTALAQSGEDPGQDSAGDSAPAVIRPASPAPGSSATDGASATNDTGDRVVSITYQGVTLEGGSPPTLKTPPAGTQYLTWPGFQVNDQGTIIFLQLTGPITYQTKEQGRRLWVTMDHVDVYLKNNLRPVLAKGFKGTPVSQFRLRPVKDGKLRLEVALKRKSAATVTTRTVGSFTYLLVSFAPSKK